MRTLLILLISALSFSAGISQPRGFMDDNPMRRAFLAPQMIMKHSTELEITPQQRDVILKTQNESQARFNELRWKLKDEMDALKVILDNDTVDKKAATKQLDKILEMENAIKRDQLEMMIVLKNTLTPVQLKKAEEIREQYDGRRGNKDGNPNKGERRDDRMNRSPKRG